MASTIAWLDTSSDEQRRVRELIALFAQPESRDELGIGQIRDAFSEILFPGTSVIQTRARYFLFVPWIYRDRQRRKRRGRELRGWADVRERRLIEVLREAGDVRGLIGRVVGPAVKLLPSSIYWSGLARYGILTADTASDQLGMVSPPGEADELASRDIGDWHPTLPEPPDGFPEQVDTGFDLTSEEARWLTERIAVAAPGSLLVHLVQREDPPAPDSWAPWHDTACADAPADVRDQLEHARLFSLGMHGAALLYNLMIGERYQDGGHTRVEEPVAKYRDRLAAWIDECHDSAHQLQDWDRDLMWEIVLGANPRVGPATRLFVDTWLNAVTSACIDTVAEDGSLRSLVAEREKRQKKAQSRLTNERLLRTWSGEAGSARLIYRWDTVRDLVTDIQEGHRRDARS